MIIRHSTPFVLNIFFAVDRTKLPKNEFRTSLIGD